MAELNTISSKFGMTAITERKNQFIRKYCTVMRPLTVALDILQGEDNLEDLGTEEWPENPS